MKYSFIQRPGATLKRVIRVLKDKKQKETDIRFLSKRNKKISANLELSSPRREIKQKYGETAFHKVGNYFLTRDAIEKGFS